MLFEKGLREEFDAWLENREWTEEELKAIDKLNDVDKNRIVGKVLCDEQLTEEMFNCFEWYLNKYMGVNEDVKFI